MVHIAPTMTAVPPGTARRTATTYEEPWDRNPTGAAEVRLGPAGRSQSAECSGRSPTPEREKQVSAATRSSAGVGREQDSVRNAYQAARSTRDVKDTAADRAHVRSCGGQLKPVTWPGYL